jgi:hypothetical protein
LPRRPAARRSDFAFHDPGDFHLRAKEPDLERSVAMNRYNNTLWSALLDEHMVTTLDAGEHPTLALNGLRERLAGYLL